MLRLEETGAELVFGDVYIADAIDDPDTAIIILDAEDIEQIMEEWERHEGPGSVILNVKLSEYVDNTLGNWQPGDGSIADDESRSVWQKCAEVLERQAKRLREAAETGFIARNT